MITFRELYRQQSCERIMELLAARNNIELARIRSLEFEQALVAAARREPIPEGSPILYHTVHWHEVLGAGGKQWAECMGARAGLIAAHCALNGAIGTFSNVWAEKVEIWIDSTLQGCAQLRYRRGISRATIERYCQERDVPAHIVVPFIDRLWPEQLVNPANTFPFTPDCEDTFQKMVRLAN